MGSRAICWALLLAIITLALYAPAIWYDFVDYDDWLYVFKNQVVLKGMGIEGIGYAFTSFEGGSWMPLTWLSLLLDVTLFEGSTAGLHFTNIFLHALTSALLVIALHRLTGNLGLSFLTAAVFALHPLRTESVVWIAERKDVLCGLFFTLGLFAYAVYATERTASRYAIVVGCLLLGLMAKPMLVTFPFVLLLLDFWPLRRMGGSWREVRAKVWPLITEKRLLFALCLGACALTYWSQRQTGAFSRAAPSLLGQALAIAGNYGFYLLKAVVPVSRTVIYPELDFTSGVLILLAVALAGISVFVVWKAFRWSWLAVGWFWFLGMLVPVIGIVPVGMTQVADRYAYLPSIGLGLALVWSGHALFQPRTTMRVGAAGIGVGLLAVLSLMTWQDLPRWRSSLELFESAIRVAPHKVAYCNLAYYCIRQNDCGRAIELSSRAIDLDPTYGASYSSRSMASACAGDYARAKRDYDAAIRLGDRPLRSVANRDFMLSGADPEQQWEQFTAVIGLEPRMPEDWLLRAESRMSFNAIEPAIADYTKAIELDPGLAAAYQGRGSALNLQGDVPAAIRDASQAIALDAGNAAAYITRAVAFTRLGDFRAALSDNDKAIELSPTNALAHQNRAVVYYKTANYQKAWADIERCRNLGGSPHATFLQALSEASGRGR